MNKHHLKIDHFCFCESSGHCFTASQSGSRCCWCLTDEENRVWACLRAPWRTIKGIITHWTEKDEDPTADDIFLPLRFFLFLWGFQLLFTAAEPS